jgi:thymidine kinase
MQERGFIEIIYGPMFSGKSSELLRKIRRFEHAKKSCLVVNYEHDNRYTQADEMATHDRYEFFYSESPEKL